MIASCDTETTIFQKGNPFARRNKLCYIGVHQQGRSVLVGPPAIFCDQRPILDAARLLVFFNAKFDLHWLRREFGWTPGEQQRIWDCQLAHFLLTHQTHPYPSLEDARTHFGIKRASVKGSGDYWSRGIDTPDIPPEIILEDLRNDCLDTMAVYERQVIAFGINNKLINLFRLHCDDLQVLEEIEWNGLNFNATQAKQDAEILRIKISGIEEHLRSLCPGVPINFDSPEHISAFLYGGTITEDKKEMVGVFKSGQHIGQPRYKHKEIIHVLSQQVEPLEGTSLKKDGYHSTDESILRQLKGAKEVRDLLLQRSKCSKELDYMQGLPSLLDEMDWDVLHPSYNQCVAATGRLSSSRPNGQNLTDRVNQLIETNYD